MKKRLFGKEIFIILFIACLLLFLPNVVQASSYSVSASNTTADADSNVTISITADDCKGNLSVSCSNGNLSSGSVSVENNTQTVTVTVGKSGTTTVTVTPVDLISVSTGEALSEGAKSVNITINEKQPEPKPDPEPDPKPEQPQVSNNANLRDLGFTPNDFKGFKADTLSYRVTVPNDVTSVTVYATPQDGGATWTASGNAKNLEVGTNKITVTVTAADKTTKKEYLIYIERQAAKEEEVTPNVIEEKPEDKKEYKGLQAIILDEKDNIYLSPEFKTNIYSYKLKVTGDLKSINLKANAFDSNAKVKIEGNENLVDGENLITITVSFDDSDKNFVYKITVYKNAEEKEDSDKENTSATGITKDTNSSKKTEDGIFDNSLTVAIIVFVVVFIISGVITFLLIKERKPKSPWGDDDDEEEYDAPGALEDEIDFKPRDKSKEKKESDLEEVDSLRGKGRH